MKKVTELRKKVSEGDKQSCCNLPKSNILGKERKKRESSDDPTELTDADTELLNTELYHNSNAESTYTAEQQKAIRKRAISEKNLSQKEDLIETLKYIRRIEYLQEYELL